MEEAGAAARPWPSRAGGAAEKEEEEREEGEGQREEEEEEDRSAERPSERPGGAKGSTAEGLECDARGEWEE